MESIINLYSRSKKTCKILIKINKISSDKNFEKKTTKALQEKKTFNVWSFKESTKCVYDTQDPNTILDGSIV